MRYAMFRDFVDCAISDSDQIKLDEPRRFLKEVKIDGVTYFVWSGSEYPYSVYLNPTLDCIADCLMIVTGKKLVPITEAVHFLQNRFGANYYRLFHDRYQSTTLSKFVKEVPPVMRCAAGWRKWLVARDVVNFARKHSGGKCAACGGFLYRRNAYWKEINANVCQAVECKRLVMVCSVSCEDALYLDSHRRYEAERKSRKEMQCLKKQLKALRILVKTGDREACLSLPEGYRPDKTSRS